MEFIGFEGDIEKRIKAAKEKAERVFYGVKTTIEEETLRLQYVISRHYGIPIFDNYFKDRTLDDLIFEIELISLNSTGGEEKMEEIMTTPEKRQELDGIFDDWNFETGPKPQQQPKKEASDKWVEVPNKMGDDAFLEKAKEFMKTGEFITGDKNDDQQ